MPKCVLKQEAKIPCGRGGRWAQGALPREVSRVHSRFTGFANSISNFRFQFGKCSHCFGVGMVSKP